MIDFGSLPKVKTSEPKVEGIVLEAINDGFYCHQGIEGVLDEGLMIDQDALDILKESEYPVSLLSEISKELARRYKQNAKAQHYGASFWYDKRHHDELKAIAGDAAAHDPIIQHHDKQANKIRKREAGIKMASKKLNEALLGEGYGIPVKSLSEFKAGVHDLADSQFSSGHKGVSFHTHEVNAGGKKWHQTWANHADPDDCESLHEGVQKDYTVHADVSHPLNRGMSQNYKKTFKADSEEHAKKLMKDHVKGRGWKMHSAVIKEETLEEISKETLGRYVKTAMTDKDQHEKRAKDLSTVGHGYKEDGEHEKAKDMFHRAGHSAMKASNRFNGIRKAVDKLVKEEKMKPFAEISEALRPRDTLTATQAHEQHIAEIEKMHKHLGTLIKGAHANKNPDWGDVGSASQLHQDLKSSHWLGQHAEESSYK